MQKSNLDVAYELISKKTKPVAFLKLWKEVSEIQGLSEEVAAGKVGKFYTQLLLDGRFISLPENKWDLRARHKYIKKEDDDEDEIEDDSIVSEKEVDDEIIDDEDDSEEENSEEY